MTDKTKQVAKTDENAKVMQASTVSSRFTSMVMKEFSSTAGLVKLSPYQKKLTQHMFIKVDAQLKDLEAKRASKGMDVAPYEWKYINMEKLAIDTVHRVELGLDALIPNHISPVPYFNKKKQKYDLDLRVGYVGKNYYRGQMSINPILNVIYHLVYETDSFVPLVKSADRDYDQYEFSIEKPFDRGAVIGGFGYIVYEDQKENKLVIVTEADFVKSMNLAQSKDFWNKHPIKMRMKTLVHRVTDEVDIDPEKVNAAFFQVEAEDKEPMPDSVGLIEHAQNEVNYNSNKKVIDVQPEPDPGPPEPPPEKEVEVHGDADEDEVFGGNDEPVGDKEIPDKPGFG